MWKQKKLKQKQSKSNKKYTAYQSCLQRLIPLNDVRRTARLRANKQANNNNNENKNKSKNKSKNQSKNKKS